MASLNFKQLQSKRLLLFSHFNENGEIQPYVVRTVKYYSQNCDKVVFISNSPITEQSRRMILDYCEEVIERPNSGYDFGGWRTGLEQQASIAEYDEVIFANDSVYGPLFDAPELFQRVSNSSYDICGLSANWQFGWHIQSYFVSYKKVAFLSPEFRSFWNHVEPQESKRDLVLKYEVGLSEFMRHAGFSLGALVDPPAKTSIVNRMFLWMRNASIADWGRTVESLRHLYHETEINPVHYNWKQMIRAGIPFIKKELLLQNPLFVNPENVYRAYPELRNPHSY